MDLKEKCICTYNIFQSDIFICLLDRECVRIEFRQLEHISSSGRWLTINIAFIVVHEIYLKLFM